MPQSKKPRQKRAVPKPEAANANANATPPVQITMNDLRMVVNIIDLASKAGAFVGQDITVAGQLRWKFDSIVPKPPVEGTNPPGEPAANDEPASQTDAPESPEE